MMPLYGFSCSCGAEIEEFRHVSECSSPKECPICNNDMQRVFTPPAVRPNGIRKTPSGLVELGNERPEPKKVDYMDGIERIANDFLNQSSDPEVRAMDA